MNVTNLKGFLQVYTCECCGRAIYKGDMYLEEDNGLLCERCVKEFTAMTLGREKRPTIRERLAQAQEQTKTKHREREKVKAKDREVAR